MPKWYRRVLNATSSATRSLITKTGKTMNCIRPAVDNGTVKLVRQTKYSTAIRTKHGRQSIQHDQFVQPNKNYKGSLGGSTRSKRRLRGKKNNRFRAAAHALSVKLGRLSVSPPGEYGEGLPVQEVLNVSECEEADAANINNAPPAAPPSDVTFGSMFMFLGETLSLGPSDDSHISMDVTQRVSNVSANVSSDGVHPGSTDSEGSATLFADTATNTLSDCVLQLLNLSDSDGSMIIHQN